MAHPTGRFEAKIIAAAPTSSANGDPQLQLVFKTHMGTVTNWMRLGGERGDQHIEISMRQLAVVGLPDDDLSQYEKIIGKTCLIDVKETEHQGKTYTNVSIVDPEYVPQARPFDPMEFKKLAARLKKTNVKSKKDEDPFA